MMLQIAQSGKFQSPCDHTFNPMRPFLLEPH
jgi:hypothetical protein